MLGALVREDHRRAHGYHRGRLRGSLRRNRGLTARERLIMLYDDHDFRTVAPVTGQPVKLVKPVQYAIA